MNRTRIKRLYIKDLLDILRDRRTLIAVIVVPIVLYPLLMLGALQAASVQADQMKEEAVVIGVQTQHIGYWLKDVLEQDSAIADERAERAERQGIKIDVVHPIHSFKIITLNNVNLEDWVQQGNGHCALQFDLADIPIPTDWRDIRVLDAQVIADSSSIRSEMAGRRLRKVLERHGEWIVDRRHMAEGKPREFGHPISVQEVDVASAEKRGGSMLGQVIPLILILLTMTGAIYPAIDLTAGERERGTLETLVVCPIPAVEIITGKFLVVTTVSILGAVLNLISMGLTLQFGGFNEALAAGAETEIPVRVLPLILLFLLPLAVFFSAILLAVCSFARTFKEAQNYVTPVIITALVPAGLAALPGSELQGVMKVMPVANMVLLTREMLVSNLEIGTLLTVVISNCLYAATAVAVAVKIFGQEAVIFADSGSWRAQFDRRMIRPTTRPSAPLALIYVALLFPIWFYMQTSLQIHIQGFQRAMLITQSLMVMVFLLIPMMLVIYYKSSLRNSFSLNRPRLRDVLASLCLGLSTWVVAHELLVFQQQYNMLGPGEGLSKLLRHVNEQILGMNPLLALVLLAVIPAVCEEMMFRGLLLNGLRNALSKWPVIIASALIFTVFHYIMERFVVTFTLGVLLAYLCWQSRSIFSCMLVHVMHNGLIMCLALPATKPVFETMLGISGGDDSEMLHLPLHVVVPAAILLAVGVLLIRRGADQDNTVTAASVGANTHVSQTPVYANQADPLPEYRAGGKS